MAEYHPLPTGRPQESAQWLEWNQQAVKRARDFLTNHASLQQQQQNIKHSHLWPPRISIQPFLHHLTSTHYDHVYEPAEDTYLLVDALQYETEHQNDAIPDIPLVCLEIGCGTGVVSAALSSLLRRRRRRNNNSAAAAVVCLATDVNWHAAASAHAMENVDTSVVLCDLASAIRGPVDILIFNPPYVPTPNEEISGHGLAVSWAGGTDGRVVIDRWVKETLVHILARPNGISYLVTVDDNRPEQLSNHLLTTYGMIMRPLFRRRAMNEFLTVHKITWQDKADT